MTDETIGVVGLGPMGAPIAERLANAGEHLSVWNRTASISARFAALGAEVASRPAEAAKRVVLTVLPDLPEVEEVLEGPDGLGAGWRIQGIDEPVLVVHGTVSPNGVRDLARRARSKWNARIVDAPLSGGTIGAREGSLSMMVGVDEALFEQLLSVFRTYATTIIRMGDVGAGSTAKACNQIVVAATVTAISEAVALARRSGLDVQALMRVLGDGLAGSEVIRQKAQKWIDEDYVEGGSARNQLKDLKIAMEAAHRVSLDLPQAGAILGLFTTMVSEGFGGLDHTGVYRIIDR